ncbi:MAG: hypothetical protein KBB83_05715 [Alphaproteobacteria bacterium]|nr:hypothetical protein [Alphaproteobacteria bacterium]
MTSFKPHMGIFLGLLFGTFISNFSAVAAEQRPRIEEQKSHLVWSGNQIRPNDCTSNIEEIDIVLPILTGLNDKKLTRKINKHLSLESLYGSSLDAIKEEFLRCEGTIRTIGYEVIRLDNTILSINLFMETEAAYPDQSNAYRSINLKTGDIVRPEDVFPQAKLDDLVRLIKLKKAKIEKNDERRLGSEELEDFQSIVGNAPSYTIEDLKNFVITEKGVRFFYNYGACHATRALEPADSFEFTFDELEPYIKADGLLGKYACHDKSVQN